MEKYLVTLTVEEREQLEAIVSKGSHQSQKVLNALILLNCDTSSGRPRRSGEEVEAVLHVSARKIDRVKKRFVEEGYEAALVRPPSQRVYDRKIDGELEARLIALSCGAPPEGQANWSLRLLAQRAVILEYVDRLSHETVRRTLKKNELKPWRKIGWVIPPQANAEFVAAMESVLEGVSEFLCARQIKACHRQQAHQLHSTNDSW